MWYSSPAVISAFIAGFVGLMAMYLNPRLSAFFTQRAATMSVADRNLEAQFNSYSRIVELLQSQVASQQTQITDLQRERLELWEHNKKQDQALFDCEERNAIAEGKISNLENQLKTSAENERSMRVEVDRLSTIIKMISDKEGM